MSESSVESGNFLGEDDGVLPKGVEAWVFSRTLKLERLDNGLVADRDGVNLAENGVRLSIVEKFGSVVGCFFKKHPKLSLFFVVASIANESCRAA